jgi:hypothetical protein
MPKRVVFSMNVFCACDGFPMKIIPIILTVASLNIIMAQTDITVGVSEMVRGKGLSERDAQLVSESVRSSIARSGRYIVIDSGLMLAILKAQNILVSPPCSSVASLTNLGALLSVREMVGVSIDRKGNRVSVRLVRVDVVNQRVIKSLSKEILATREAFLARVLPEMTTELLMQDRPSHEMATSLANDSSVAPGNRQGYSHRSIFLSPYTWIGVTAAAIAGGIFYFSRFSGGTTSQDGEIPLNNEPIRNRN